jgi:hypothetical protein
LLSSVDEKLLDGFFIFCIVEFKNESKSRKKRDVVGTAKYEGEEG